MPLLVLLFLLLPPSGPGEGSSDEEARKALAATGADLVLLEARRDAEGLSEAESRRRRELEDRLIELATELLGSDPREMEQEEIEGFLLEALDVYEPDAALVLRERQAERPVRETESRMYSVAAALYLYYELDGYYPPAELGLTALLAEGLLPGAMLVDHWGRPFRYEVRDEGGDYALISVGADGAVGTVDDLALDAMGEWRRGAGGGSEASSSNQLVLGRIPAAEDLWQLRLTADGLGAAYIAQRDDGVHAGWVGGERGPFESLTLKQCGSVAGAYVFTGVRDGRQFLVTPELEAPADTLVLTGFVEGTTELFRVDRDESGVSAAIDGIPVSVGRAPLPGEAGDPNFDRAGKLHAWRERTDAGYRVHLGGQATEYHEWASNPILLELKEGTVVSYRLWDGERCTLVIGDRALECSWARDPVASPDGSRWASVVQRGGAPVEDFEQAREDQVRERVESGFVRTRAFTGGAAQLVVDWEARGLEYHHVEEPVFSPDGQRWAFRVRDDQGWRIVEADVAGTHTHAPQELVERPRCDRSGTTFFYGARDRGVDYLFSGSAGTEAPLGVEVTAGDGYYAMTIETDEGTELHVVEAGGDVVVSKWEAAEIDGFLPDGQRLVCRVTHEGQRHVYTSDGLLGAPFEWVAPPVSSETGEIAYVGERNGRYYAVVRHEPGREELGTWTDAVPGFAFLGRPVFTSDGTVAFPVIKEGEAVRVDGYHPIARSGKRQVLLFEAGDWSTHDDPGSVRELQSTPQGDALVYLSSTVDRDKVNVRFPGGGVFSGRAYDSVESLTVRASGEPVYLGGDDRRTHAVIGTDQGEAHDLVSQFGLAPDGRTLVFEATSLSNGSRVFIDHAGGPYFTDVVDGFTWTPDLSHLVYRAVIGGRVYDDTIPFGGTDVLVVTDREQPGAPQVFEFDAISPPVVSPAGDAVEVAALSGTELARIRIPLGD